MPTVTQLIQTAVDRLAAQGITPADFCGRVKFYLAPHLAPAHGTLICKLDGQLFFKGAGLLGSY